MRRLTGAIRPFPFCGTQKVVIATGALLAALLFPAGASAVNEDITPPQLDALSVSTNAVNVTDGPKSVTVQATLSDPPAFGGVSSGVSGGCITYSSPAAGHRASGCFQRKLTPMEVGSYSTSQPGGTGRADTRKIPAPSFGGFPAQQSDILVWDEKQDVTLAETVLVDIAPPFSGAGANGTYDATTELSTTASIPAGTRVNSHFLHNNPVGLNAERSGCVSFGSKVLGVMVLSQKLNDSEQPNDDSFSTTTTDLGSPNANYPDTQAEGSSSRGLELDNNNDYVSVSSQQVCVNFNVLDNQDEIRVITVAGDGQYEATVTFPQFGESGVWKPFVSISDHTGNFKSIFGPDLAAFNVDVTVTSVPDITPPDISSLTISPDSVTVSPPNGPQTLKATATITDNLSGVAGGFMSFQSPTPRHFTSGSFQPKTTSTGAYPAALQGGTGRADTRKISPPFFGFPAQDPDILVWDEKQNVALGDPVTVDIAASGFYEGTGQLTPDTIAAGRRVDSHFLHNNPAGLNSERSGCVSFGSKVIGVMLLSQSLNDSEQPNDDTFPTTTTTTTDLGSPNANYPDTQAEGSSSRGLELDNNNDYVLVNSREVCVNFNVLNNQDEIRVITEAVEDQYEAQIQVRPYVEHGTWSMTSLSVFDRVGNQKSFPFPSPIPASFDQSFEVVSDPEDFTPPVLGSISIEPTCDEPEVKGACVDATESDTVVTLNATVTDNLAGVTSVFVSYINPSGRLATSVSLQRTSGDQFRGTMTIPRFAQAGHWRPTSLSLSDGPGNFASFSEAELLEKGFDISIGVSRIVRGPVTPGGDALTTGDSADDTNPIQSALSVTTGGTGGDVTLAITPRTTETPPDFYLLDQQLDITAPAQPDASHPMKIEFRVDSSVFDFNPQVELPPGCVPGAPPSECQLTIFKNGNPVPACTAVPPGAIAPDPCVVEPQIQLPPPDGDRVITIYTTTASSWNVGIDLTQTLNEPPDCSTVTLAPKTLWPPNHKFRLMRLTGGTDPDTEDVLTLEVTGVTQDEPLKGKDNGDLAPDARLAGSPTRLYLRAERNGNANGRVYRVAYKLSDGKENCTGTAIVSVPHNQKGKAVDSGPSYNSLGP
jgi:hypothetical protein